MVTIPLCMEATIIRNPGLVALVNRGGVTHNTRPIMLYLGLNLGPVGL